MKHLTAFIILAAFLFTGCSKVKVEPENIVGKWNRSYQDERICEDGAVWYTFYVDGTCLQEVYNALGTNPEEDTHYNNGTWELSKTDIGINFLTIDYDNYCQDSFIITGLDKNKIHMYSYGKLLSVDQSYILTRCSE